MYILYIFLHLNMSSYHILGIEEGLYTGHSHIAVKGIEYKLIQFDSSLVDIEYNLMMSYSLHILIKLHSFCN